MNRYELQQYLSGIGDLDHNQGMALTLILRRKYSDWDEIHDAVQKMDEVEFGEWCIKAVDEDWCADCLESGILETDNLTKVRELVIHGEEYHLCADCLKERNLCENCLQSGIAEEADHVYWSRKPFQTTEDRDVQLCAECHENWFEKDKDSSIDWNGWIEIFSREDFRVYGCGSVDFNDTERFVAIVVGVRPENESTATACGGIKKELCSAWYVQLSDWEGLTLGEVDAFEAWAHDNAWKLYQQAGLDDDEDDTPAGNSMNCWISLMRSSKKRA